MQKTCIIISATVLVCMLFCGVSSAEAVNDGFQMARKIQSRYFDIYIENGVDLYTLTAKLTVPPSIKAIIRESVSFSNSNNLTDQLDLFFLAVSEILDIRLKKFKCKIKICNNAAGLSRVADKLFGQQIQAGGFYVVAIDTLYVDADNVNIHILGHELSHAIQNKYFIVPPPEKIQEVLSGYVEFQLRKYTHSLPN